jgi:hypothetical protein
VIRNPLHFAAVNQREFTNPPDDDYFGKKEGLKSDRKANLLSRLVQFERPNCRHYSGGGCADFWQCSWKFEYAVHDA